MNKNKFINLSFNLDFKRKYEIFKLLPAIKFPIVPELTKRASSFPTNVAAFFCNSKKNVNLSTNNI